MSGAASPRRGTVVAFGDSLMDGTGATPGADNRFTDKLAERLAADRRPLDVVNAGIGGNRLLNDSPCYGDKATDRFRRDVLNRPGVRTVIIHLGANDIGAPKMADPCMGTAPHVTARQIIDAHEQLIRAAHARGVKAVGATILPMKGALFPVYSEQGGRSGPPSTTGSAPAAPTTPSSTSTVPSPTPPIPPCRAPATSTKTACTPTKPASTPSPPPWTLTPSDTPTGSAMTV